MLRIYKGEAVELALIILEPHILTWSVLGMLDLLVPEVLTVHALLKQKNTYSRPIFDFLLRPDIFRSLEEYEQQSITVDSEAFRSVRDLPLIYHTKRLTSPLLYRVLY